MEIGVSKFKCDFLTILFWQHSLAVTEDILVTEHARKLGFAAVYAENISTGSDRALFLFLSLLFISSKICSFNFFVKNGKNRVLQWKILRGRNLKIGFCNHQNYTLMTKLNGKEQTKIMLLYVLKPHNKKYKKSKKAAH